MRVTRILNGLERSTATGPEADTMARMGFLEWAFAEAGPATPQAARRALSLPEAQNPTSAAARAFVGFLEQAIQPIHNASARRGGRARRLH